jgi:hypothetical protein
MTKLSAETVNAIEDWVTRLEICSRNMLDAADQMSGAADRHQAAATKISQAVREIPSYIKLER